MGEVFLSGEKLYLFLHSKIKMYIKGENPHWLEAFTLDRAIKNIL